METGYDFFLDRPTLHSRFIIADVSRVLRKEQCGQTWRSVLSTCYIAAPFSTYLRLRSRSLQQRTLQS